MIDKSRSTLNAAQRLIDICFYTESVHCSYYAVLQLMRYKLAHTVERPLTYDQQDILMGGRSSHEALLIEIKNRIGNPKIKRNFGQEFEDLKSKRIDADYSHRMFTDMEGMECKQQADRLISKLNNYIRTT